MVHHRLENFPTYAEERKSELSTLKRMEHKSEKVDRREKRKVQQAKVGKLAEGKNCNNGQRMCSTTYLH